tara:strand:+ start:704 stop:868 length:165 start_codon:yes stop_codon:yes gene_type:complete
MLSIVVLPNLFNARQCGIEFKVVVVVEEVTAMDEEEEKEDLSGVECSCGCDEKV